MARITGQQQNLASRGVASAAEVCAARETAAAFAQRELEQVAQRMETVSNRLSAAKKRLQEHFGVAVCDSAGVAQEPVRSPGMDGLRQWLDQIDARLHSIADGMEELI